MLCCRSRKAKRRETSHARSEAARTGVNSGRPDSKANARVGRALRQLEFRYFEMTAAAVPSGRRARSRRLTVVTVLRVHRRELRDIPTVQRPSVHSRTAGSVKPHAGASDSRRRGLAASRATSDSCRGYGRSDYAACAI